MMQSFSTISYRSCALALGSLFLGLSAYAGVDLADPTPPQKVIADPAKTTNYGRDHDGVDTIANFTGPDGAQPQSILEDSAGHFYGTTLNGGKYNKGTVFAILDDGKLVNLVHFDGKNGATPEAGLLLAPDGSLYGTTKNGGSFDKGTVFVISPKGHFSVVINFDGKNGAQPDSGLLMSPDGTLYGSTQGGGEHNQGIVFKITPKGEIFSIVAFDGKDGSKPGTLVKGDDGSFYGTCGKGGGGFGTVFKLSPDGHLTTLVVFDGKNGAYPVTDLSRAESGLFYGATIDGGKNNLGTVFSITPSGRLNTVASFDGTNGAHPDSGLVAWNNGYFYMIGMWHNMTIKSASVQWAGDNFCGTTTSGGINGIGTVFRVGEDGDVVTLVSFTGERGLDLGANPNSLIPGQDGNLYGTTGYGGRNSQGTVFRLQLQLWILPVAGNSNGAGSGSCNLPIVSR